VLPLRLCVTALHDLLAIALDGQWSWMLLVNGNKDKVAVFNAMEMIDNWLMVAGSPSTTSQVCCVQCNGDG